MEDENKLIDPLYWQRAALNDNAYNVTEAELQALIETFERELSSRNIDEDDEERRLNAITIQSALNGFRVMLQQIHQNESTYQQIVESGIYYSFYFKDDNHRDGEPGDICLILDGEKTGHIIPFETLSDLQDSISMFIYGPDPEDTEKYEPLRAIVGSRPFLPVPWYINLCVLKDEELALDLQQPLLDVGAIVNCTPQKAEKIIAGIDKITNLVSEGMITPNATKPTKVKTGKNISANVALSFDPEALGELSTKGKINAYDMEVLKAISSLYQAGNNTITPGMIVNFLSGGKKTKLNDTQRERVENSMKKLMGTTISIDITGEAKCYNFDIDTMIYEEPMISAGIVTVSIKGNITKAYNIKNPPLLFAYASQKKQIVAVPVNLLDTPISKNEDMIVLHGRLATRIQIMKNNRSMDNRINYGTLFDYVYGYKMDEYTEGSLKKKKSDFIKYVNIILTDWIKKGFISGFEEYKDGRKKAGVAIRWNSQKRIGKGSSK